LLFVRPPAKAAPQLDGVISDAKDLPDMRKRILAAAATLALGAAVAGTWLDVADAQPAPPQAAAAPADAPPPPPPPPHGPDGGPPWMRMLAEHMHWGHGPGGPGGPGGPAERMMRLGALIYTPADRQLTTADVQKIAEAFLLWHGNHSWKVTNVSQNSDGSVGFAFATSDGGVIARFTMDSHTGRVERTG
jgi:hypothetical protein